ncbi:hypothetical protein L7F22_007630 [Adiantum nelumboides]|nr:hypothetical protein [Adiantum nelumboides]
MSIDDFDLAHEDATDDTPMLVNYVATRLQQAMGNLALQGEIQQQLHAYGILPPPQQERDPEKSHGETSKNGLSTAREVETPYQELKQLPEGKPSFKKRGYAPHKEWPSKKREKSESQDESKEDVALRRRRAQRSPNPSKQKRSLHSPHCRKSKREEKSSRKKKERKRSPSSPSSSPSSSSDESSGYSSQEKQRSGHQRSYAAWKSFKKLKKFKNGGMNISFLTYYGTFGATNKLCIFKSPPGNGGLAYGLRANGEAPKTWKALRASIMKQFLASNAKDEVLTKWRSLKLIPYESIHNYVDKFWDLHLKGTVYKKIDFEKQKQQFGAGLSEDMMNMLSPNGLNQSRQLFIVLWLFLQGKFDEAERFIEERAQTRDVVPSSVPIFTHFHAVILFARAGITGTEEDRKQAMERLQHAASLAGENIPKQGWAQSIASWGMGYFVSQSPKSISISEKELSCRIIEAEATYLSALLCFFEESLAAFFKAALLIRRAIRGYKHCNSILQNNGNSVGSEHDIGAVKLGFGGFSLAISMLPPKLLRLLSVLGFPCDRKTGLFTIEEALRGGGLRASVSGVSRSSIQVVALGLTKFQEDYDVVENALRLQITKHLVDFVALDSSSIKEVMLLAQGQVEDMDTEASSFRYSHFFE